MKRFTPAAFAKRATQLLDLAPITQLTRSQRTAPFQIKPAVLCFPIVADRQQVVGLHAKQSPVLQPVRQHGFRQLQGTAQDLPQLLVTRLIEQRVCEAQ